MPVFSKKWGNFGLTDDDLRVLEIMIMSGPTRAPVVKGTGGLRKLRFGNQVANRGKSGAYRVCYVYFAEYKVAVLITIFGKNEKSNLTMADRNGIASVIRDIERDLASGL
jgi:mRNA-degrading endonuclease RelE of RelBE toxin-antitoxin system